MTCPSGGEWNGLRLAADGDVCRVAEGVGAGDDDLVALLQAAQDFDLVDAARTDADVAAIGHAVGNDEGIAARAFVDERTTLHGEHVVALVQQHAYGEALALAELAGRGAIEAQARG